MNDLCRHLYTSVHGSADFTKLSTPQTVPQLHFSLRQAPHCIPCTWASGGGRGWGGAPLGSCTKGGGAAWGAVQGGGARELQAGVSQRGGAGKLGGARGGKGQELHKRTHSSSKIPCLCRNPKLLSELVGERDDRPKILHSPCEPAGKQPLSHTIASNPTLVIHSLSSSTIHC